MGKNYSKTIPNKMKKKKDQKRKEKKSKKKKSVESMKSFKLNSNYKYSQEERTKINPKTMFYLSVV